MIQTNIVSVDSSFSIATGGMQHYLVLQLPNGAFVRTEVDEQAVAAVLEYVADGGEVHQPDPGMLTEMLPPVDAASQPVPTMEVVAVEESKVSTTPGDQLVQWGRLPDDVLSPALKAALGGLGVSERVTADNLAQLVQRVQNEFSPTDWAAVGVDPGHIMGPAQPEYEAVVPPTTTQVEQAAPAPLQQPPIGQIQWADGGPILPGMSKVARTVPKDDMGYPVVHTSDVDPGEIVATGDVDEDGVGQL